MNKSGKIFIISGPSGSGKTSIAMVSLDRLNKEYNIGLLTTYTTRAKRDGEVDGKDYFFISHEEFKKKENENFFLETTEYVGHLYGSPRPPQSELDLGKSFFLLIEIEGAKNALKEYRDAFSVWVTPPDLETLKTRLNKRATESPSHIENRLNRAKEELEEAHKSRVFQYVLVNDIFEQAVEELVLLVKGELG